jgi:hypothetical protein
VFGLNILLPARTISQGFPQCADIEGKVVFLNKRVGPDTFNERFLLNCVAGTLDKDEKGLKDFGRQGHTLPLAQQDALRCV